MIRPLLRRPRLLGSILAGVAAGAALWLAPHDTFNTSTRWVLAWDVTVLCFITSSILMMRECDDAKIRARAAREDEGHHFILGLAIVAAFASILAIAAELPAAKAETDPTAKALLVALIFGTVLGSWFFVQIVFALHYAHEFYAPDSKLRQRGGLKFPDDDTPDYWDFLHFGSVIGVAAQTADVAFTSKRLRRIGTLHGIVAFVFNTVVLALAINLLAGLFT